MSLRLSGGRRLQSPAGSLARPTPSRVRQAVMNILAPRLAGSRWLDLCSGSGSMACEALQRGVSAVVAVERDRRIAAVARANLTAVAASPRDPISGAVHTREVLAWLGQEPGDPYDLIYADPPYRAGLHGPIATAVRMGGWLQPDGLLLWECASDAPPSTPEGWRVVDQRRYGGTSVIVLQPWAPIPSEVAGEHTEKAVSTPALETGETGRSAAESAATAVLVPGGHEQPHQGHGEETENDAAEKGFDHGPQSGVQALHNSPMAGTSAVTSRHQP